MRKLPIKYENPIDNLILYFVEKVTPYLKKLNFTPNIITTIGNIFGVLGIYYLYINKFIQSSILYFMRYICDCMDGFYARKYNMVTKFGDWYDHCSDMIITIIYLLLMYSKNAVFFYYFIILYSIIFYFTSLHIYYQEEFHDKNNSASLKISKYIVPNFLIPKNKTDLENKLLKSRWFGCGTITSFLCIVLIIYKYV